MYIASGFTLGWILYELFDSGLANTLGLETFTHGTNPINYLKIRFSGGNPKQGGKPTGSTRGWSLDSNLKNHFYVFKDSEYTAQTPNANLITRLIYTIVERKELGSRFLPRVHALLSGYNLAERIFSPNRSTETSRNFSNFNLFFALSGVCSALISPRLRFRFSKIDADRFQDDPAYNGAAYYTTKIIEPWRIGLLGSFLVGMDVDWISRIQKNPHKFLTGIVQLTCAIALAIFSTPTLSAHPFPVIAGALLA